MQKLSIHIGFFFLFLISGYTFGQSDSTKNTGKSKTQFRLGIYYNTHLNYYGRTDSLKSSGIIPLAELTFRKGFYINAAPVFISNAVLNFEYAGSVATIGYRFNNDDKFTGNFYLVKPFYKESSQLVQSALKAQFSSNLTWMNKVLNVSGGSDIKWSGNIDFGASGGVDHIFKLKPGDGWVMVLDPSAFVYAGTQRFSKSYYKQVNPILFPPFEQEITENVNQVRILSYEFSMPMVIAKNKFQFILNPAYVIPQNLIEVENQPALSESGSPMLHITAGCRLTF